MKCCMCNKGIDDGVEMMKPIDPKGAPNRRWACTDCLSAYEQGVLDGQELYLPTFDENDEINGIQQISHYHS